MTTTANPNTDPAPLAVTDVIAEDLIIGLHALFTRIDTIVGELDRIEACEDHIARHAREQQVDARSANRYTRDIVEEIATAAGRLRQAQTALRAARRRAVTLYNVQQAATRARR